LENQMNEKIWRLNKGDGPLVATAIHDGHEVRAELTELLALDEDERLREEDPFTADWTSVADNRVVGLRSRFEVDLNRPREKAVYLTEEDAWGLKVWKSRPGPEIVLRSLSGYDNFYSEVGSFFRELEDIYGHFVVFDLHSYNHRRSGPDGIPADPAYNPQVNIGTATMDRKKWAPIVDRFIADLRAFEFNGRHLDVRENIKFKGGQFPRWIHENFPESGCAIAIEFKKFFMDEWTGKPDNEQMERIRSAITFTVPGVIAGLKRLSDR